jgi:mannose-6-phosphate isomerase-like protein (cupin superfamily)
MKALLLMLTLSAATAAAQTATAPPPPKAPAPGSPATYKSEKELLEVLKKATARGGMTTSAVSITDQYSINVVHRDKPAGAIAHAGNTELHYIIEGSATVVTGGKLVRGATAGAGTIDGGETRHVSKGDIVIVPENSAHWYKEIDGAITYLEVRWLAPK